LFLDEVLRKAGIGVWKVMPPAEPLKRTNNTAGTGRATPENLWRLGCRKELVDQYNTTIKKTFRNLAICGFWLAITLFAFTAFAGSFDVFYGVLAVVSVCMVTRHYTKAWGGYAGNWSDYEHDPVRMAVHNAYVLSEGRSMM